MAQDILVDRGRVSCRYTPGTAPSIIESAEVFIVYGASDNVTDHHLWNGSDFDAPPPVVAAPVLYGARDIRNCFTDAEIKRVQLEAKTDADVELIMTKLNTMGDHKVRGDSATLVTAHAKLASIADPTMPSGTLAPAALTAIVAE